MNIIVPKVGVWIKAKGMCLYPIKVTNEFIYALIHYDIGVIAGAISRRSIQKAPFNSCEYISRKEGDDLSRNLKVENYKYYEQIENGAITIWSYRDYAFVIDGHLIIIPKEILSLHRTTLGLIRRFSYAKDIVEGYHIQLAKEPKEAIYNKILSLVSDPIKSELEYYELSHRTLSDDWTHITVKNALRLMAYVITRQNIR